MRRTLSPATAGDPGYFAPLAAWRVMILLRPRLQWYASLMR
jgi:hypothetical protein